MRPHGSISRLKAVFVHRDPVNYVAVNSETLLHDTTTSGDDNVVLLTTRVEESCQNGELTQKLTWRDDSLGAKAKWSSPKVLRVGAAQGLIMTVGLCRQLQGDPVFLIHCPLFCK